MTDLIEQNIADPILRTWVMLYWNKTTKDDDIMASVCMMGTLQRYFAYVFLPCCRGIPIATSLVDYSD
jgi:hypothetical protein